MAPAPTGAGAPPQGTSHTPNEAQIPLHPAHEDDEGAALTASRVVLSEPILNGERMTGTLQIPTSDGKAWRPAVRDKQPVSVALYTHCIATAHIIDRELPAA